MRKVVKYTRPSLNPYLSTTPISDIVYYDEVIEPPKFLALSPSERDFRYFIQSFGKVIDKRFRNAGINFLVSPYFSNLDIIDIHYIDLNSKNCRGYIVTEYDGFINLLTYEDINELYRRDIESFFHRIMRKCHEDGYDLFRNRPPENYESKIDPYDSYGERTVEDWMAPPFWERRWCRPSISEWKY